MIDLEKLPDGRDWMDFPTKNGKGLTIDTKSAIGALEEIAISSEGLHPLASINWKQNASMLRNIAELIERMHAALAARSSLPEREDERKRFEAWVKKTGSFTEWTRYGDGYAKPLVQRTWWAWCSAVGLPQVVHDEQE